MRIILRPFEVKGVRQFEFLPNVWNNKLPIAKVVVLFPRPIASQSLTARPP
jgi:hypothetical protein